MSLIIETSLGDLEVDLFVDKAPQISKNFLKLCKLKHYNNALFYEVQKNYLTSIQSKKPTTISVELGGNESYIEDEINPSFKHNKIGLLSTNNQGQNRNNSEFFITLSNSHVQHFDEKHTIFGQVQVGIDILERFNNEIIVDSSNLPYINHRILHTFVIDDPFEDPENFVEPDQSPEPIQKSDNDRLEFHEKQRILNESDKTEEQIIEEAKKQVQKVREIKLQMIGDIPDADMKPPENVLFVCQLNAITQERDLEIIFSRFGVITRCEVVRDWKTGESLNYAFIEFETEKSCQEAYFKMKGALIDERRIHVDFSQSLQKFKNNKRQNHERKGAGGTSFDNIEFTKFYRNNNYNSTKHRMVFDEENNQGRRERTQDKPSHRQNDNQTDENHNKSERHNQQEHWKKRRSESKERKNSESKERVRENKEKKRSVSKERKRSTSKNRKRSTSRNRKRSTSRNRERNESRERKRSKSKDRKRSKSREKKRKQKRSQSPSRTFSKTSQSEERERKSKKQEKKRERSRSQKKKDSKKQK